MKSRRVKWSVMLRCLWLTVNLSILQVGLGTCVIQQNCEVAVLFVYPSLMLLSFPGSYILELFNEFLLRLGFAVDLPAPLEYSLIGLGMIFIGYLQWFYILPAIVRKTEFVKLLPSRSVEPLTLMSSARPSASPTSAAPIRSFDDVGRTPLERAIAADE